jgi:transposase InsO family protein
LSRISDKLGYEPIDDDFRDAHLFNVDVIHPEYVDIIHYLDKGTFPENCSKKQKQRLVYRAESYTLISGILYKQGKNGILRRCINPSEISSILKGCHGDNCGGYFAGFVTTHKALQSGYWWPTLFKDAAFYAKKCDPCQKIGKPISSSAMPLHPILAQVPFEKWGIDFVGPIKPPSRNGRKWYILVATEYVTEWAEAIATKTDNADTVAKILYENIITRFGCPKELVSDRGTHFINSTIEQLLSKYMIKHRKSTPYHPRANGQTEKTNGILCKIITKTVQGSNTNWDQRVFDALWAYRIAYKVTTKHTPFQLVYGQEAILPIELEIPSLRIAIDHCMSDLNSLRHRYAMLEKLNETRAEAYLNTVAMQNRRKSFYDSKLSPKTLNPNDLVLLCNS